MKNLWTLFCYEMEKVWKRPVLWIVLALFVGFLVHESLPIPSSSSGMTYTAVKKDGSVEKQFLTWQEAFQIKRAAAHLLDGQKMDEAFFEAMREAMPDPSQITSDFSIEAYLLLEAPAYYQLCMDMGSSGVYTAEHYYSTRGGVAYLNNLTSERLSGISDEELSYWREMETHIKVPYTCYNTAGIEHFEQVFYLSDLLMPLAVGVCLCNMFPLDRRERLVGLVFSSKLGRRRLVLAKLLAGASSAIAVAAILFFTVLGVCHFVYGISPAAQIQLHKASSMPITVGQELLLTFLALALYR